MDSPLSHEVLVVVNLPSPLQSKAMLKSLESNWQDK